MKQAIFKFEERPDYSPENFLVSPSNREAYELVTTFPWKYYGLAIHGPKGSGKTYLSNIAAHLGDVKVIEDVSSDVNERELLHTINFAKENGGFVLITSEKPLAKLGLKLPDLTSRLSTFLSVQIGAPDAELFYALFSRYFTARQLIVSDEVINYLATRVERSFESARSVVEKIDNLSLSEKRNITIPLVKLIVQ